MSWFCHRYNIECVWVLAIYSDLYRTFWWQKVDKKSIFVILQSIYIKSLLPQRVRQYRLIIYNSNVPNKPHELRAKVFSLEETKFLKRKTVVPVKRERARQSSNAHHKKQDRNLSCFLLYIMRVSGSSSVYYHCCFVSGILSYT